MIAIVDYGMGNIHSVQKALELLGAEAIVTNKPEDIRSCVKAVLPGVGAFKDALCELEKQDLIAPIVEHIKNKKPFLGICLGMQLLFEESEEAKGAQGLGVFKGKVKRFKEKKGLPVPHMGWNQLKKTGAACPLLEGLPDNAYVYFCHSYYPEVKNKAVVGATTDYGVGFASLVWQDSAYGAQFHPEKSQGAGLKILENFVKL